ncbi:MAG: HDOD domain-containing protein [Gammaproteobacteria bacterium]|nr:HDOD domain-containing protein [Gammaproteobacteria bacterium]
MDKGTKPQTIDRFIIEKELGHGRQGIVYLASDPDLHRKVAIKAVHLNRDLQHQATTDQLLSEARIVSRLQHANIVTVYDVGIADYRPYLVLEYIEGSSLRHKIRSGLKIDESLRIMRDILAGVAAAHAQNIAHGDIKPANILIHAEGHAKVADFGLAHFAEVTQSEDTGLSGTPLYMAPEYIETRQHQIVSDVFSIGLVFYEMLTGKSAVDGDDIYQILNRISNEKIAAPSSINQAIDEGLDDFILKALVKDPQQRFADAGVMLQAFSDYLSVTDQASNVENHDATVAFLLRRMRHKSDFPVFSQTISILNKASSSDTESLSTVSNAILKDYSLTNKVLRLVNSAYYNRAGTKISTISRAVVMLGINPVRSIAAALMLFEHMQNKLQSDQLKEDAVESLFSALIANDISSSLGLVHHEEAFLCALLQQLGKRLVRFYLHEEAQAIDKLCSQGDTSEANAVSKVLGTSYHQLGMSVAHEWGFPEQIIDSMKPLNLASLSESKTDSVNLQVISQLSNSLGAALKYPAKQRASSIKSLTSTYSKALKIDHEAVNSTIGTCEKELVEFARLISFNLKNSSYYQNLPSTQDKALPNGPENTSELSLDGTDNVKILTQDTETFDQPAEKALTDGIQDITNTLTGDYTINQVFQMILETIYRALSGSRVVLCLKDKSGRMMSARFGYGESIEQVIDKFSIPLAYQADVFHIAFKNNQDIRIENTQEENIRSRIPDWYHRDIGAKSFTIFPIVIKHSPIALIYIDNAQGNSSSINDAQLSLLKTLRNQALLAIKNLR